MRLTIGIPFYNNERTLSDAIRSVFAQTFGDWELILLDDGSTDASLDIARAVRDPRVKVIAGGENRGLAYRLNQITGLARGELIARMDGDDLTHPERLKRQVRFLNEHPDLDLVGTGICAVDSASRPVGIRQCGPLGVTARALAAGKLPVHASVLARARWCRENPYNPSYRRGEDFELWCRAYLRGGVAFGKLQQPLYFMRDEESVTLRKVIASYRVDRKVLRTHGPALVGWPRTGMLIGRTYLKEAMHRLFAACGAQMELVKRRNQPLSSEDRAAAEAALNTIRRTPVPGLPETEADRDQPLIIRKQEGAPVRLAS